MKVAITGGSGYVGGLLAEAHAGKGDTVHVLTRSTNGAQGADGVRYVTGDLAAGNGVPREFFEGADVLYHCAAELTEEPLMRAANVEATRSLLAAAAGSIGRWVQLSTAAVYGDQRSGTITEDSPIRPAKPYAATKSEADRLVQENGAFDFSILRPVAVIGPRMPNRSIHAWLDAIDRGLFFFVGEPGAIVNFVNDVNVVHALMECATHPAACGNVYNLSQDAAIESFVATLATAIGRDAPGLRVPETIARAAAAVGTLIPGFPLTASRVDALTRRVEYPPGRIERELGYRHGAGLDRAVEDLAAVWKRERGR